VKIYWAARRLCCGVATVLGFGAALLMWPSSQVLVIFVLICFGAGLCRYLVVQGGSTAAGVSWSNWPALARHAVRAGLGGVALGGLADISIGLALLLALVATLTSYPCIAALRSRTPNKPGPLPVEPLSGPYPVEAQLQDVAREVDQACLRALSNAELCLAWRRSYCSLVGTTSLRLRAVVVTSRQAYLDEMERRDARGLTAWLAAGARAASGPERYLHDAC
jgi:hypothetical protein